MYKEGMMGLIVADALGVPVEFMTRLALSIYPVKEMRGYGTYNQPAGTWSDDSTMAIATLDSLIQQKGFDYKDIMERYVRWYREGAYTPFDKLFDIGNATHAAISRYIGGSDPLQCGGATEYDNGNGSLMRILPACLYMYKEQKEHGLSDEEVIVKIHEVSALTHAHARSLLACGMYFFLCRAILDETGTLEDRLQSGINQGFAFYGNKEAFAGECKIYNRTRDLSELHKLFVDEIKSSGYVVHTFEAALWCLLQTDSYKEAVLTAVNLGEDTDTVAAITGGLAGLFYGYDSIPEEWLSQIQKREWLEAMIAQIE